MRIKLSSCYAVTLYMALLGQACMLVGLPYEISPLTTIGTYSIAASALISAIVWFIDGRQEDAINKATFVSIIIFLAFALLYSSALSFDTFLQVITFLELPIFLLTADKLKSRTAKNVIYAANMVYPILFGLLFSSPFAYRYYSYAGPVDIDSITLGYSNPNETAIHLLFNFIILFSAIFRFKNYILKLLCLIGAAFSGHLITLTDGRAAIFLALVVLVLSLVLRKVHLKTPLLLAVFAVPVLFFIFSKHFTEMDFMGESFDTGRHILYATVFDNLDFGKFVLGDYAEFGLQNTHNAFLSVFASLGIIVAGVFVLILIRQTKVLGKTAATGYRKPLLLGFLAIIIHSAVEAAVLVAGTAYASSVFMLYYLILDDSTGDSSNENTAY